MTTEQSCIDSLEKASEEVEGVLSKSAYEELGFTPSAATVIRVFGTWNDAKREAGLDINPSTGCRTGPKPSDVEIPGDVDWDELTADQRWHYKNASWNTKRSNIRRAEIRETVYQYKNDRCSCQRCGEEDPACLEFHHEDESEKEMAVGRMITYGYGIERVFEEINKCQVLCANCHRKEHYELPTSDQRT